MSPSILSNSFKAIGTAVTLATTFFPPSSLAEEQNPIDSNARSKEIFRIKKLDEGSDTTSSLRRADGSNFQVTNEAKPYSTEEYKNWIKSLPKRDAYDLFLIDLKSRYRGSLNAGILNGFRHELSEFANSSLIPHPALRQSLPDISIFSKPIDRELLNEKSQAGEELRARIKIQSRNFTNYILRYQGEAEVDVAEVEKLAIQLSNISYREVLEFDQGWMSGWPQRYRERYQDNGNYTLRARDFAIKEDPTGSIFCSIKWQIVTYPNDQKFKTPEVVEKEITKPSVVNQAFDQKIDKSTTATKAQVDIERSWKTGWIIGGVGVIVTLLGFSGYVIKRLTKGKFPFLRP